MYTKKIILTIDNQLHYSLTLKKIFVFSGRSTDVATGLVIPPHDEWVTTIQQDNNNDKVQAKYVFSINGLISPLSLSIKTEYLSWKDRRGQLTFHHFNDKIVTFGHGNIGEKIGGKILGYTEEPVLHLTACLVSSVEKREKHYEL